MQLAPIASAPAVASPASTPAIKGEVFRWEGSGYYSRGYLRSTGSVVGDQAGYASLADARTAASKLTAGEQTPAAGIFEVDGRFHARSLSIWAKYDDQLGIERGPFHFEDRDDAFAGGDILAAASDLRFGLRVLVDGNAVSNLRERINRG